MRENRPYGSEGGVGASRSRPLSWPQAAEYGFRARRFTAPRNDGPVLLRDARNDRRRIATLVHRIARAYDPNHRRYVTTRK